MAYERLDGQLFAQMIRGGANNLARHADKVDALNVFPVPDGDTGTNMKLSFSSGVQEMNKTEAVTIAEVAKSLSKGLLMGARGNSGVILSQLFRGFAKRIEADTQVDTRRFAEALQQGVETAYKAVMKPVEGTILTVAKDVARAATKAAKQTNNITELVEVMVAEGYASLRRTPDLLPILKQVGVVDSGGQGLLFVYEGFLQVLKGEVDSSGNLNANQLDEKIFANKEEHIQHEVADMMAAGILSVEDITFGYCTEFIIRLSEQKTTHFNEHQFRHTLSLYGDSLLVIADEELVKVHIHAEQLSKVLELAQGYGQLTNIKIENMREQFLAVQEKSGQAANAPQPQHTEETPKKTYALITVAMGEGIEAIFKSLGADVVIAGGQTMNPSTETFVQAIEALHAEQIIILPNNSNIILAAEQAAELVDIPVLIIPTKTIPQGLSALLGFNPTHSLEVNRTEMHEASERVKSGQVTYAVRDTQIEGLEIKKDHFMGIEDGKIVVSAEGLGECTQQLLKHMLNAESEIVTLIYGQGIEPQDVQNVLDYLEEAYPDLEVEVHAGGQPLYAYLIAVE